MKLQFLVAFPLPAQRSKEEKWEVWKRAFEIAYRKNGGRTFGRGPVAVDIVHYGNQPVPVWVLKRLAERLGSAGCLIEPLNAIKSVCFKASPTTKGIRAGSLVITITKIR